MNTEFTPTQEERLREVSELIAAGADEAGLKLYQIIIDRFEAAGLALSGSQNQLIAEEVRTRLEEFARLLNQIAEEKPVLMKGDGYEITSKDYETIAKITAPLVKIPAPQITEIVKEVEAQTDKQERMTPDEILSALESLGEGVLDQTMIKGLSELIDEKVKAVAGGRTTYGSGFRRILWASDITNAHQAAAGTVLKKNADGTFSFLAESGGGGGGGTPAGSSGDLQWNSGSSTFAATSNLNWDNASNVLKVVSDLSGGITLEGSPTAYYSPTLKFIRNPGGAQSNIGMAYNSDLLLNAHIGSYVAVGLHGATPNFRVNAYPYDLGTAPNNFVSDINIPIASGLGLVIRGAASQTGNLQEWRNSADTVLTKVTSSGRIEGPTIGISGGTSNIAGTFFSGNVIYTSGSQNIGAGSSADIVLNPVAYAHTAGSVDAIYDQGIFSPTSGTGVYNTHVVKGTINQTGGANGVTRGLYINQTITSAADYRSIETVNGNALFGTTSGRLGVGVTSPSGKIHVGGTDDVIKLVVQGASGQSADLSQWLDSSGTTLARVTSNGRLNIGTGTAADASRLLLVSGNVSGGVATFNRTNATTNAVVGTMIVKGTSTGDMVDGFGSAFQFAIQDNAGVENLIGGIRSARSGADNTGWLDFIAYNAGVSSTFFGIDGASNEIYLFKNIVPNTNDLVSLGTAATSFSDLFLASGGVINFNNGNATLTHSAGLLTSNVDIVVPDEAYNATTWDGSLEVPTKNAIRDKIESIGALTDGDKGDITVSSSGTIWTIDSIEGVQIATISNTVTLTNKRITKRTGTTTSSATPTINTDNVDFYSLTAQAVDITSFTTNLSGTPTEGQTLWIAITGTASRAITWGTSFESSTVTLPTTTVSTNRLDVGFVWNTVTSKWRCVASC